MPHKHNERFTCITYDEESHEYFAEIYDKGIFTKYAEPIDRNRIGNFTFTFISREDDMWIGGIKGILRIKDGKLHDSDKMADYTGQGAFCFLELEDGRIWFGGRAVGDHFWHHPSDAAVSWLGSRRHSLHAQRCVLCNLLGLGRWIGHRPIHRTLHRNRHWPG